jgi:AcrR family transcriptional regulator
MQPVAPTKTRTYNSTRRSRQAAQTREEILTAAVELFGERGWSGTTLAAIASQAGVAVETIYSGFGSKKGLFRAALDVAVVGDADAVPLGERPEALRLGEGTLEERLAAAAKIVTDVNERTVPVWRALLEAARSDEELERWRVELDARRRVDIESGLVRIFGRTVDARQLDLLWAIFGHELYMQLVIDAGMSRADYEACLIEATVKLT